MKAWRDAGYNAHDAAKKDCNQNLNNQLITLIFRAIISGLSLYSCTSQNISIVSPLIIVEFSFVKTTICVVYSFVSWIDVKLPLFCTPVTIPFNFTSFPMSLLSSLGL